MKLLHLFGASMIALAAPALAAQSATTVTSSKSNSSFKIDPRDPDGERQCAMAGGKVVSQGGALTCVLPDSGESRAVSINGSKSNSDYKTGGPVAADPPAAEATTVIGSKSNSDLRTGGPVAADPPPAEATSLNSSKSNSSFKIDPRDPDGEKKCVAQGGTVSKNSDGTLICTIAGPSAD